MTHLAANHPELVTSVKDAIASVSTVHKFDTHNFDGSIFEPSVNIKFEVDGKIYDLFFFVNPNGAYIWRYAENGTQRYTQDRIRYDNKNSISVFEEILFRGWINHV